MKIKVRIPGPLAVILFLAGGIFPLKSDALWEEVLDEVNRSGQAVALDISIEGYLFDRKGTMLSSGNTRIQRSIVSGTVHVDSVREDGDFQPDQETLLELFGGTMPRPGGIFDRSVQSRLTLTQKDWLYYNGEETVLYDYRFESEKQGPISGQIWIDPEKHLPLRILSVPEKTSGFLDTSRMDLYFHRDEQGLWIPYEMQMEGSRSGILSRNVSIRMQMGDFSEL